MNPSIAEVLSKCDIQDVEYFNERSGILEFECKLSREDAEALAFDQMTRAILKRKEREKNDR